MKAKKKKKKKKKKTLIYGTTVNIGPSIKLYSQLIYN